MRWQKFVEPTVWAIWWLIFGGAGLWVVVGSIGYFSKSGWLPIEVSAWVQAVGSVLAILAAILIAGHDSRVRKSLEVDAKKIALSRAYNVVEDSLRRVSSACASAERSELDLVLWEFIKHDLIQAQEHLKETASCPGVDSKVHAELFEVRTSIELAANAFNILSRSDKPRESLLKKTRYAHDRILTSLEILKLWKDMAK